MNKSDLVKLAKSLIAIGDKESGAARSYLILVARVARLRRLLNPEDVDQYARVVGLISRTKKKARVFAKALHKAFRAYEHLRRRFCVVLKRDDLAGVLAGIEPSADQTLTIAYQKPGPFVLQGRPIDALEGDRCGAQQVYRADLESLLHLTGDVIALDVFTGQWVAYVTFPMPGGMVKQVGPIVYALPQYKEP